MPSQPRPSHPGLGAATAAQLASREIDTVLVARVRSAGLLEQLHRTIGGVR
jgi:short-subunit dehydrogenase